MEILVLTLPQLLQVAVAEAVEDFKEAAALEVVVQELAPEDIPEVREVGILPVLAQTTLAEEVLVVTAELVVMAAINLPTLAEQTVLVVAVLVVTREVVELLRAAAVLVSMVKDLVVQALEPVVPVVVTEYLAHLTPLLDLTEVHLAEAEEVSIVVHLAQAQVLVAQALSVLFGPDQEHFRLLP